MLRMHSLNMGGASVAHHWADEEDELQEEAAEDKDAQLPLFPPLHSTREIHSHLLSLSLDRGREMLLPIAASRFEQAMQQGSHTQTGDRLNVDVIIC